MALSQDTDTEKNLSSHFLTRYDMLEASIFSYRQTLDVTDHVYPSQLDVDGYLNHHLFALNVKKRIDDIITHIFLCMHNINTMSNI